MTYEEAVKQKMLKQKIEQVKLDHPFEQSYIVQNNFEIRKFLFWSYQKEVAKQIIPTNLCKVCNRLAIEHD